MQPGLALTACGDPSRPQEDVQEVRPVHNAPQPDFPLVTEIPMAHRVCGSTLVLFDIRLNEP